MFGLAASAYYVHVIELCHEAPPSPPPHTFTCCYCIPGLIILGISVEGVLNWRVSQKACMLDVIAQFRIDLEVILRWHTGHAQGRHWQDDPSQRLPHGTPSSSIFHSTGPVTISGQPTFIILAQSDRPGDNIDRGQRLARAEGFLQHILQYHWARSQEDNIHEILGIIRELAAN